MKSIFLTGFMGSGKTTIGRLLSEELNLPVVDTDQYIEKQLNKTIREIFEKEGEEKFRTYEHHFLKTLTVKDTIITTGGGIVLNPKNRKWMKDHGIVIYLHCDLEEIFQRLEQDTTRPLLDGDKQQNIKRIYMERIDLYREAHYTIDTTSQIPAQIVTKIKQLILTHRGDR